MLTQGGCLHRVGAYTGLYNFLFCYRPQSGEMKKPIETNGREANGHGKHVTLQDISHVDSLERHSTAL